MRRRRQSARVGQFGFPIGRAMRLHSTKAPLRFGFAAALWLAGIASAFAQQYMPLPPNSIIGNVSGGPAGPANAVPIFPDFVAALARSGVVTGPSSATPGHAALFGSVPNTIIDAGAVGPGTVTSVTCGTGLSGGTIIGAGTCALPLNSATIQSGPFNPTGTTSTTLVMEGLGSTCHLTPTYSSRIFVQFTGVVFNATATDSTRVQAYFGTGTAPAVAAPVTGTSIGGLLPILSATANQSLSFTAGGLVTGLTPGTAYWLDLALDVNAGTGTAQTVFCSAHEVL
jgi:hypothetical protein